MLHCSQAVRSSGSHYNLFDLIFPAIRSKDSVVGCELAAIRATSSPAYNTNLWRRPGLTVLTGCWFALYMAYLVLLPVGVLPGVGFSPAQAATFTVTNTDDSGPGSLRQAILDANDEVVNTGADTIEFAAGLAGATIELETTADSTNGPSLLVIDSDITINGPVANPVTITRSDNTEFARILEVRSGTANITGLALTYGSLDFGVHGGAGLFVGSAATCNLSNCTLADNSADEGAGIKTEGALTVTASTFTDNYAGFSGGAILKDSTFVLSVTNSTFSGNEGAYGGAIENANTGNLTVDTSTFTDNAAFSGGAIDIISDGTVNVTGSTFADNSADGGGAISFSSNTGIGTLTISNSTLAHNEAETGGGIFNGGTLTVNHSTIASNFAVDGGGIMNSDCGCEDATLAINNSIVADNFGLDSGPDILADDITGNYNLISLLEDGLSIIGTGNLVGTEDTPLDAGLELDVCGCPLLKDNGGPTETIALVGGSPAINAGDLGFAAPPGPAFDQRGTGFPRVFVGPTAATTRLDIGAFELQTQAASADGPGIFHATVGTPLTLTLTGSDPDGDALSYIITALPPNGFLYDGPSIAGRLITDADLPYTVTPAHQVTYLPPGSFTGVDAFAFKVNDGIADSNTLFVFGSASAATGAIISEFRTRGPNGAGDEYVEIANITNADLNVSGWVLAYISGGIEVTVTIPLNRVIPKGGHLLFTGTDYSLGGADGYADGDVSLPADIPDSGGVALRNATAPASNAPLDAVGFTAADPLYKSGSGIAASISGDHQASFMRQQRGTPYVNTSNNASDFDFVAVTGGAVDGVAAKLGAPGPEGLFSPDLRNDTIKAEALPAVRDVAATSPNATFGTLALRYKVTNNSTTETVTRLRFRAVMIPSGGAISGGSWQTSNGTADLRLLTSANTTAVVGGVTVPILGSTLEEPPSQSKGGGLNSSMTLDLSGLTGGGIGPGESVNVQFNFGVVVKGTYRTVLNIEGSP